jgi:hypothetical protein
MCKTSQETVSMPTHPSEIANTLSEKFQLLHEAFTDLASDAAQFHGSLDLREASARTLFNSLTRIMAFSDHVHVALNLMGEDVVAIESAFGDPLGQEWNEQLQDSFDDWFKTSSASNYKVN